MPYPELVKPVVDGEFLRLKQRRPEYKGYRLRIYDRKFEVNGAGGNVDSVLVLNDVPDAIFVVFFADWKFNDDREFFLLKGQEGAIHYKPTFNEQVTLPPAGINTGSEPPVYEVQGDIVIQNINENEITPLFGKVTLQCHPEVFTTTMDLTLSYAIAIPF